MCLTATDRKHIYFARLKAYCKRTAAGSDAGRPVCRESLRAVGGSAFAADQHSPPTCVVYSLLANVAGPSGRSVQDGACAPGAVASTHSGSVGSQPAALAQRDGWSARGCLPTALELRAAPCNNSSSVSLAPSLGQAALRSQLEAPPTHYSAVACSGMSCCRSCRSAVPSSLLAARRKALVRCMWP